MYKLILCISAANGFIAVALGAFGAHGLKGKIAANLLLAYETAVQYHFYHVLALFGVALLMDKMDEKPLLITSAWLFVAGMIMFSGSLYLLALGGPKWLGPVTPIGGVALLAAWLTLLLAAVRQ